MTPEAWENIIVRQIDNVDLQRHVAAVVFEDFCSVNSGNPGLMIRWQALIGCTVDEWNDAKRFLMSEDRPMMVHLKTNRLFSKGLWKEAEKQRKRREQLQKNGRKGGRPKKPKVSVENQNKSLLSLSLSPSLKKDTYVSLRGSDYDNLYGSHGVDMNKSEKD